MDQKFTRTAGNTAASNRGFEVSVIGGMEVTGSGPAERHRRFQKQPRSTMARRRSLDSLQDATIECLGTEPSPSIAIADVRLARFQNQRDRGAKLTAYLSNLLEFGPKGTGKSHIYAEFSPHGMLISGSEVTAPKLFVSNASGKIGLVGYWDCVCFDEFAGKDKKVDKALVDIMKNYMANRTFSRGIEQLTAEASMVFMGNTQKSVAYMLKHSHFFEPLPDKYIDSAFLDRLHAFNPGWEVAPIRHELFTNGYGFVVDYIAEVLKHLRTEDFTGAYKKYFEVSRGRCLQGKWNRSARCLWGSAW